MKTKKKLKKILNELSANYERINFNYDIEFLQLVVKSNHIFVSGVGRSGLIINTFANRLLHLGFNVSVVGEITSPASTSNDLLIICSGSGNTDSLIPLAKKAKLKNMKIALITMDENSLIAKNSDIVITVPGKSPKIIESGGVESSQPMASIFEQMSFLLFDSYVLNLMEILDINDEDMFSLHTDLE